MKRAPLKKIIQRRPQYYSSGVPMPYVNALLECGHSRLIKDDNTNKRLGCYECQQASEDA